MFTLQIIVSFKIALIDTPNPISKYPNFGHFISLDEISSIGS